MKDTEELQEQLFQEMKARYKEDDESLPYFFNEYWYVVKFQKEKNIHCSTDILKAWKTKQNSC